MNVYYNENDPKAAAWLRQLITDGLIPAGYVDERSICDVRPADLSGYVQCHFFAGIGGWALALQLAGWPSAAPVWTGSCPCQPYSQAGQQKGDDDPRNLWPQLFRLIRECRPVVVFGEQVASAIGKGWLDGISADLETEAYACGAVVLGAHSVNAPHIRQRLFWVADSNRSRQSRCPEHDSRAHTANSGIPVNSGGLADSPNLRGAQHEHDPRERSAGSADHSAECATAGRLADTAGSRQIETGQRLPESRGQEQQPCCGSGTSGMVHPEQSRLEGHAGNGDNGSQSGRFNSIESGSAAETSSPWDNFDILPCLDGKARRIESSTFPLANGVPARVVRLRGYGNAIVPQVAAEFIQAYCEAIQ